MALSQQARRRKRNLNVAFGMKQEIVSVSTSSVDKSVEVSELVDDLVPESSVSASSSPSVASGMSAHSPNMELRLERPIRTTMKEILASIPGFEKKVKRKRTSKKATTAERLAQTRDGCLDLETPNSILVHANMRVLMNKHTFVSLPELYQQKLIELLPEVDKLEAEDGTLRISGTALTNEFFARACMKWRDRLAEGEFTAEHRQRQRVEAEKERTKLDPWKIKNFEPFWGYQSPKPEKVTRNTRKRKSSESSPTADDNKKVKVQQQILSGIAVSPEPENQSESDAVLLSSPSPTLSRPASQSSPKPNSQDRANAANRRVKLTSRRKKSVRTRKSEIREIEVVDDDGALELVDEKQKRAPAKPDRPESPHDEDDKPLSSLMAKSTKKSAAKSTAVDNSMSPQIKKIFKSKKSIDATASRQPIIRKATLPAPPVYDDEIYHADAVFKKPASRVPAALSLEGDAGKCSGNKGRRVQWEEPLEDTDERLKQLYKRSEPLIPPEVTGSDSDESLDEIGSCTFSTSLSVSQPSNYGEDQNRKRSPLILKIRTKAKSEDKSQFILPRISVEIPTDTEANVSTTDSDLHDTSFESITTTSESTHDAESEVEAEFELMSNLKGRSTPNQLSRSSEIQSSAFLNYVTSEEPKHQNLFLQIQSEIERERLEERRKKVQLRHQLEADQHAAANPETALESVPEPIQPPPEEIKSSTPEPTVRPEIRFEPEDSIEMPIVEVHPPDDNSEPENETQEVPKDHVTEFHLSTEISEAVASLRETPEEVSKMEEKIDSETPKEQSLELHEEDGGNLTSDELNLSFQSLGSPGSASISPFLQDDELREIEANYHEGTTTPNASNKVCSAEDILDCLQQKQAGSAQFETSTKVDYQSGVEPRLYEQPSAAVAPFEQRTEQNDQSDKQSMVQEYRTEAEHEFSNAEQPTEEDYQAAQQYESSFSFESQSSGVQMDISFGAYQEYPQPGFENQGNNYMVLSNFEPESYSENSGTDSQVSYQNSGYTDSSQEYREEYSKSVQPGEGDLLNQAVSAIGDTAEEEEIPQVTSEPRESSNLVASTGPVQAVHSQGQMAILQVTQPSCSLPNQILTATTSMTSAVIPVMSQTIQLAPAEIKPTGTKPVMRVGVPLLPKPMPAGSKPMLPPARSYGRSSKTPPGSVNLERSYQICKAVIQSSPNCRQLENQLKPPSAFVKDPRPRATTRPQRPNNMVVVTPGQRPLAPRLPAANEQNIRPTAIVMPTPTVQQKPGNDQLNQSRLRTTTPEVSQACPIPQATATPVIVGPGGVLMQQPHQPIVLSVPARRDGQQGQNTQVVISQGPRELAPIQQQATPPRLLQIQTSTNDNQSNDKVNIIVLNSMPQGDSNVVQLIGGPNGPTLVQGSSAPMLVPAQTRPMFTTAPLVGVMQDGALKILQVNTSLGGDQVITTHKPEQQQTMILTSSVQQNSQQFLIQNPGQVGGQQVILRMQGPPTSQPMRFQAAQVQPHIRLAPPSVRPIPTNDPVRPPERFRYPEGPRWAPPPRFQAQLPQPQRVASAPLPPNVRVVQPSIQHEPPTRAASVPENYRGVPNERYPYEQGYNQEYHYERNEQRYYPRASSYESHYDSYEQNVEYKCECSLKAWAMCVKCGAFSHDDCMTASQVCSSCVVK